MNALILSIAKEFSRTPGPRTQDEGDFSGEVFLKTLLKPRFEEAIAKKVKLIVDLDGTEGYATSFLEASFGGLARMHPENLVLNTIEFVTNEEAFLKDEIEGYIKEARIK